MFNKNLEKIKSKILPWWNDLNNTKKITFVVFGSLTLFVMIYLSSMAVKTDYQVLYRDLDPSDAGEVVDYLVESKVSYSISEGGTAILVPSKDIRKVRFDLASAGMPKSGVVGYEIFDQTNLGMTDFLQKVNYRRALEGELTKTISRLEEVKSARVHLVIPEQRLFKEDKIDPSASVVLFLNRHKPLSQKQIEGVVYLVASSVEGLTPENITVLDSSGKMLSARRGSDMLATLSSNQLEMKKNIEAYLEDKAQSMLDAFLGLNRSVVKVSAKLNFDQVNRTIESYDPDNIAVRSEEISEEKQSEIDSSDDTNRKRDSSNNVKNTIRNYEVNKTIEQIVNQVGNIEQLQVAVSFDGTYELVKGSDGKEVRQYVPRPQEELDKFVALVKGTVGFSEERNDIIEIANIPFETFNDDWEEKQRLRREEQIRSWLQIGYKAIAVLVFLFIFWNFRKKYKEWQKRRLAHKRFLNAQAEIQKKAAEIIPKISKEPKLIDHIRKLGDDTPKELAKVIKTMMVE